MIGSRNQGRYNLHRLGWSAFEDLCMQVMRVVLGETCTRFTDGADAGRDGWFRGVASAMLVNQNKMEGTFVLQCKHTSKANELLALSDMKSELAKVARLASQTPLHYLILTNRQVSAVVETKLRQEFEAISGVQNCMVLSEAWIEDTLDAHPALLRLVPRLYGIGDLSQIVSFVIEQQTLAVLEDLSVILRSYVPTQSYRVAEDHLRQHGFVVLVGPPASGKSAIAGTLCLVNQAQDSDLRVLRIEHADDFKGSWSPTDANTVYWVDDVFGETTLDAQRLREWSSALEKVEAARKRGAKIIFCTRDYILAAASERLKRAKVDFLNDAKVRVDVTALSTNERESILYNHVKDGDISQIAKRVLKPHLPSLARLSSFSPELARRLGSKKFSQGLRYDARALESFFEQPVQHFRDVIHGLAAAETAALAVCLLSNNAVPDPLPDASISTSVLQTYDVTPQQIRGALEMLEGSLIKRVRQSTSQTWQVHHPTMIEALQQELSGKSSQFVLYLQAAKLASVIRDTTTLEPPPGSRQLFVPESVYAHLIARLLHPDLHIGVVAAYLAERASDTFLQQVDMIAPELLDNCVAIVPEPDGCEEATQLAVRLGTIGDGQLLTNIRRNAAVDAMSTAVRTSGWTRFLEIDGIDVVFSDYLEQFLHDEFATDFESVDLLYEWYSQDLDSVDEIQSAKGELDEQIRRLYQRARKLGWWHVPQLDKLKAKYDDIMFEKKGEQEEHDRMSHYSHNDWTPTPARTDIGRFADVDE